ncbi:YceD family protein [Ancrocorticia populi]|uniref:YceD family protein n=2 Tax=Ancrocorticia populi TaxID=2175228 RepID=UPI002356A5FC|nr:YceD family protein [Ancrocorticia populi]
MAVTVSVASLPRQEGSSQPWVNDIPAPPEFGLELLKVPEGSPMHIDLLLQSVSEGVLVQGTADVHLVGQCARCLRDIEDDYREQITELVYYPERKAAFLEEGDEEVEESQEIVDDSFDLEAMLRDSIVPNLPFRPLCRPDCPGLCPECGERWDDLPEDHHHDHFDSRFDGLAALQAQMEADQMGADESEQDQA